MPITFILKAPTESQMALSNQVKQAINDASVNLREALAFAARTEHPVVISSLTEILIRLDSLEQMEEFMDKFVKPKDIPTSLG